MKNNRMRAARSGTAAALVAAFAAAGCVETSLTGVILHDDLFHEELMLPLIRGVNSEFVDITARDFDVNWFNLTNGTDEITNDGVATSEENWTIADYRDRPGDFGWEQSHEAAWSGYFGVAAMKEVFGDAVANAHPLTAQSWIIAGWSERWLGENYCELIYSYSHEGAYLFGEDPNVIHDPSQRISPDSAFRRSLFSMQQALAVAQAAVAAGAETPANDPIFEPEFLVNKAHAGIAQAAVLLSDWDLADEHAALVPIDFTAYAHHDPQTEDSPWEDVFFRNDDWTMWNTPAVDQWEGDPRVPFERCGFWATGEEQDTHAPAFRDGNGDLFIVSTGDCAGLPGKNSEIRAESNLLPLYASLISLVEHPLRPGGETGDDADFTMASGREMLLIRAEAALRDNNLGLFKTHIDALRDWFDLDPIALPATAGALEYPNAEDDAWSILDRERYLTLYLTGRRHADMRRWNHPFMTENHQINPRVAEEYAATIATHERETCMPIAQTECNSNGQITCENLRAGT